MRPSTTSLVSRRRSSSIPRFVFREVLCSLVLGDSLWTSELQDLIEVNTLDGAFAETKVAKRLRSKLNAMIENVDELVNKLEVEKKAVEESIADPAIPDAPKIKKFVEGNETEVLQGTSSSHC